MKIFSAQLKGTTIVVEGATASITGSFTGSVAGIDINATNTFTASTIARLNSIETISSSNDGRVNSLELFTSSTSARLNSIETISASNIARINSLETTSASVNTLNTTQNSRLSSLEAKTGSLASTGSNTFIGIQTITGSLFVSANLIVQGTSSLENITASAVSIGTNIINLNTANPAIRYAGLSIGDSGSIGSSGSFLYDSVQDEFIFVHRGANTTVTSSVVLMGPQTYDSIGNETYLTSNRIPKGAGNEHLVDSNISDDGNIVRIQNTTLAITGSRVGINTSFPTQALEVSGSITTNNTFYISKTPSDTVQQGPGVYLVGGSGASYTQLQQGVDRFIIFGFNGSGWVERLTINNTNGKVGIGETSPDNTYQGLTIKGTDPSLRLKTTNASGWVWTEYVNSSGTNNFSMGVNQTTPYFGIKAGAGLDSPNFAMISNGNIGIGTTSPGYLLDVIGQIRAKGSSNYNGFFADNSNSATVGGGYYMMQSFGTSRGMIAVAGAISGTTDNNIGIFAEGGSGMGAIKYYVNGSGTPTHIMAANGNVGIGTINPGYKLDVYTPSATSAIRINSDSNQNSQLRLEEAGAVKFAITYVPGDSSVRMYSAGSGSDLLNFKGNNVGIGITNPGYKLTVNGSTRINRSIYNWYQAGWQGNSTYWHMKTNMNAGAGGNIQYTMSLFKGYFYSYSDPSVREGAIGFHNWDGTMYQVATQGNLFTTVYRSSDNFVVLVIPSGLGESGVTIDWHQAFAYPFVEAVVTAAKLHGATTGGY